MTFKRDPFQPYDLKNPYSVAALFGDVTVTGLLLFIALRITAAHFDMTEINSIVIFCAMLTLFKIVFVPQQFVHRYFWARIASVLMTILCSWWLLRAAENTRTGWFLTEIHRPRIAALVAKAPAYILMVNGDNIIVATSENIDELTGYTRQELIGQSILTLVRKVNRHEYARRFAQAIVRLQQTGSAEGSTWVTASDRIFGAVRKDGRITPIHLYVGGIRWSGDIQFPGDIDTFAILTPITEKELYEEILINAILPRDNFQLPTVNPTDPNLFYAPPPRSRIPVELPKPVRLVPNQP